MRARVLVVDDNPLDRRIACRAVEQLGHVAQGAEDGRAALELIGTTDSLDVVLLDLLMPGLDGFAVLAQLRAEERLDRLPVIVVSAADAVDDVVRSIELGATDHLAKPLQPPLLRARLTASLARKCLRDLELDHLAQVERLIAAVVAVEQGSTDLSVLDDCAWRTDDLGTLARVFRRMADRVQAREEALLAQVDRLRIEVDQARIGDRVAEVTGTEPYRSLAQRATALRRILTDGEGDERA